MSDKERIERLESVLGKLVAWSVRELGVDAARQLLEELGPKDEVAHD